MGLDLRNDILTSVVALSCAIIGDWYWPLADPIGAIIVWLVMLNTKYKKIQKQKN